ncbi:MAG: polysaccharide biosynthesis tyrosine autokinase [Burkholderiaceae bacterium]
MSHAIQSQVIQNHAIQQYVPPQDAESEKSIDIASYLDFMIEHRWFILGIAFAITCLGAAYAFLAKPVYQSNILVQVEDSTGSAKNVLGEMADAFDVKTAAPAEIEVLRSRMVIAQAVSNIKLYIDVRPKYFPVIGAAIARYNKGLSVPGFFGWGGYVWASEKAEVTSFNVPHELERERFVLTALGNDQFRLVMPETDISLTGEVGAPVMHETPKGKIELHIERLHARPGAQFFLTRFPHVEKVEELQSELKITEKGKQSGVIGVSLEGTDALKTAAVLNEIGREYIRQNVDRRSEEAKKSLAFLEKQLPELKSELELSESKYNQLRSSRGTIDLTEEAKMALHQSVLNSTKMVELRQKKEELLARYQEAHPVVEAVTQQIRTLNSDIAAVEGKIRQLPAIEQEVLRLMRDVKVNTELYTSLLNTSQQLKLVKASKVGNARLLDPAIVPVKPVKPKRSVVVGLAALIGLFIGLLAAYVKKLLYGGVDDPHEIEGLLGLPITATIPHSAGQEKLYLQIENKQQQQVCVLANNQPDDHAIESFRSFRTSLQFSMLDTSNNIVMLTGPTPGVGKSFVSVNFSTVLASAGKKVLLIDADMRKGYLHRHFGLDRGYGLSQAIAAPESAKRAIHRDVLENVDFLSTGALPAKPSELISNANFSALLKELSTLYDYVVIDTAPVLAVSDPIIVGRLAGTVFNVVRGGVSTIGEIEESVKRFNQAGTAVTGIVFNDLKPRAAQYGFKYAKYRYTEYAY